MMADSGALLEVERLRKEFALRGLGPLGLGKTLLRAVDDVSFAVRRGETFGLVGESGCGKSTVARCVVGLLEPSAGRIVYDGTPLDELDKAGLRDLRRRVQIVFQDCYGSLNPRLSAFSNVAEPLIVHAIGNRAERAERTRSTLAMVGIAQEQAHRKPHGFSGGQLQRIGIARALVLQPEMIVLDEPVSALDVSIQAQVLNLLREIQDRLALTYVFIVHDLAVAEYFCDRIAVLYLGAIVELADNTTLFKAPLHPYTVALLSSAPSPELDAERRRTRIVLRGEVSALSERSQGCRFRARCPVGQGRPLCDAEEPPLTLAEPGHWVACHYPGELSIAGAGADGP